MFFRKMPGSDDEEPRIDPVRMPSRHPKRVLFRGLSKKALISVFFVVGVTIALLLAAGSSHHKPKSAVLTSLPVVGSKEVPQAIKRTQPATGPQYFSTSRATAVSGASVQDTCSGVAEREPPTCIAMPERHALRIAIAALPPEAYTKKAPPSGNLASAPVGDPAWLDSAFRAAWDFATSPYEQWSPLDFAHTPPSLSQMKDALMSVDIPDDVEHPPPDRSAPILSTGRLKQAVALASSRLARLASTQPAFTFTSQSQRDLERIVIANMLSSPFATIVDLRATTMQELKQYDYVFVPFPLIAMRDNPKMAVRFQDIMVRRGLVLGSFFAGRCVCL
jgi:hypothetical protein